MRSDAPPAFDANVFAADYVAARKLFLDRARAAGADLRHFDHPLKGPDGEALATDVAWLGDRDAPAVLVLLSATHGVEGFCGSGAQVDFLAHPPRLPDGVAVLLVHAINPHGFAWLRRVTEDGVDLNRNYVDFDLPLPANPGYEELADAILPPALSGPEVEQADAMLAAYEAAHGRIAYEEAVSAGQFSHPDGLFYGGLKPTWSRRASEAIIRDYDLASRQRVGLLDFHTGLGPFGYGEPICDHPPGSEAVRLAREWYGDSVTEPALGTSSSVAKFGLSDYGWQRMVGEGLVFIALEFGTYSVDNMVYALRADHWLHRQEVTKWQQKQAQLIKAAIRRHFYPDTDQWKRLVIDRTRQCIGQALTGLSSS